MLKMFYIQYEVRPMPESEDFSLVGSAFANCFVMSESKAMELALAKFSDINWEVVGIEEEPFITTRENYIEELDWLEWYDEAIENGECYIFHRWPLESQEVDVAVH